MKKYLPLIIFIFVFLLALFSSAWILKPPEDQFVKVGYIINTRTGEKENLYCIREVNIFWWDYRNLQVRLNLPNTEAHDRTTVVLYVK